MFTGVFIYVVLIGVSSASYLDTLSKCSVKDWECLRNTYQSLFQSIGSTGISEVGIPPFDPFEIYNVTISLFGMMDITMDKGSVTGVSGCTFDSHTIDLEKETTHQDNTCSSLTIEGGYTVKSNAIINSIIGNNGVYGAGKGVLTLDKVRISSDCPVHAQKRDDGEIYLKFDYQNVKLIIEFLENVHFQFDQLYIGDQETSKTLIPFLNQNWKLINKFGTSIGDKVAEIYISQISKFFDKVPTKYFLTDDLSSIAKP